MYLKEKSGEGWCEGEEAGGGRVYIGTRDGRARKNLEGR